MQSIMWYFYLIIGYLSFDLQLISRFSISRSTEKKISDNFSSKNTKNSVFQPSKISSMIKTWIYLGFGLLDRQYKQNEDHVMKIWRILGSMKFWWTPFIIFWHFIPQTIKRLMRRIIGRLIDNKNNHQDFSFTTLTVS